MGRAAALAWLTDRDPDVRAAVGEAVRESARAGRLDARSVRRLEMLAQWAPGADAERIRAAAAAARTAGVTPEAGGPGTIRSAHITGVDGSGLALVILEMRQRTAWAIAGLTVREGQGIWAAWQQPVRQQADVDAMLARVGRHDDLYTVDPPLVRAFLAQRLFEGCSAGYMPTFTALDIAATAGLSDLAPTGVAGPVRHAELDAVLDDGSRGQGAEADALARSETWPDHLRAIASWAVPLTETGTHVDTLVSTDPDPAVDTVGERYRTVWADRLTWLARFTRAHGDDAWTSFHLVAGALYGGRRMAEIPFARRLIREPVRRAEVRLRGPDDGEPGA